MLPFLTLKMELLKPKTLKFFPLRDPWCSIHIVASIATLQIHETVYSKIAFKKIHRYIWKSIFINIK